MNSNKNLLKDFYYVTQALTTLRPGPKLQAALKKAGIEKIEPPSQEQIDAFMNKMLSTPVPSPNTNKPFQISPYVNVMVGGNWWEDFYNELGEALRSEVGPAILLALVSFLLAFVGDQDDPLRAGRIIGAIRGVPNPDDYILDAGTRLSILTAAILAGFTSLRQMYPLLRDLGIHFARLALLQANPTVLNITNLPISGELDVPQGDLDPIAFVEFQDGNKVAVIGGVRTNPYLVDSLQAWIAKRHAEGLPPRHPVDQNTIITRDNVQIFTVKLVQGGGKRKQSKRSKTRKGKRQTRKQ